MLCEIINLGAWLLLQATCLAIIAYVVKIYRTKEELSPIIQQAPDPMMTEMLGQGLEMFNNLASGFTKQGRDLQKEKIIQQEKDEKQD